MAKKPDPMQKIKATRGMATKIAAALRITLPSISKWKKIPAERVVAVEAATGIPREELRPDLYEKAK